MLLDIEARIGELSIKEPRAVTKPLKGTPRGGGSLPSGLPPKHERLGMSEKRIEQSQAIAKHPDIVEKVNENIPEEGGEPSQAPQNGRLIPTLKAAGVGRHPKEGIH